MQQYLSRRRVEVNASAAPAAKIGRRDREPLLREHLKRRDAVLGANGSPVAGPIYRQDIGAAESLHDYFFPSRAQPIEFAGQVSNAAVDVSMALCGIAAQLPGNRIPRQHSMA
jgi:hypothetical protein